MFYVGALEAVWLGRSSVPVMLSRSRIRNRRSPLDRARQPWFLDSAAFTELAAHGRWTVTAGEWAKLARRYADEAGQLAAVATQDWLCTPMSLTATGLDVDEHQARTLRSFLDLRDLDPELPWVPTLQGVRSSDYQRHADAFTAAGVDLAELPTVGVGSIATGQHTAAVASIIGRLRHDGLANLHAFGAKGSGLRAWGWAVASADSMAWSTIARSRGLKAASCELPHPDCRNCLRFAEEWAPSMAQLVGGVTLASQLDLDL